MIIGIPRERKTLEKRVAITPDGASELIQGGHTVLIEHEAGSGSYFTNDHYIQAGCQIVPTLKDVWTKAELIVKVKEPHPEEYPFFRPDLLLFDYLHLASMPEVTKALLNGKVNAIAYELVQSPDGKLPLLEPMSEVAGRLSVINGASALLSQNGGRGILLGGAVGVEAGEVVIVGAGTAGRAACDVAAGMGANVTVLDISHDKLERIKHEFHGRVQGIYSTYAALERESERADLLVGAVLLPGAAAPKLITRSLLKKMKPGAVFVDISVDQGGCAETTRPTSLEKPTYEEEGVIHYAVPNMPAQTPRTSTLALTAATLPYIKRIANLGFPKALEKPSNGYNDLRGALNTMNGKLTNKAVSEATGFTYTPIESLI